MQRISIQANSERVCDIGVRYFSIVSNDGGEYAAVGGAASVVFTNDQVASINKRSSIEKNCSMPHVTVLDRVEETGLLSKFSVSEEEWDTIRGIWNDAEEDRGKVFFGRGAF